MVWVEAERLPFFLQTRVCQHTPCSVFPLRKRLQFFGRAEGFDWPLLLFAPKNPAQAGLVLSSAAKFSLLDLQCVHLVGMGQILADQPVTFQEETGRF